jgi:two-component system, cell cycle response regulator DivK
LVSSLSSRYNHRIVEKKSGEKRAGRALMTNKTSSPPVPVVLLVQPDDDGRRMYVEFLKLKGLETLAVSTAADAIVAAPRASVIVTGILLRGDMDGVELIRRLRAEPSSASTPIVVLTACAWETERARAEQAGCDSFLPKPCLPDALLRELRRLVGASRPRSVRRKQVKRASTRQRTRRKAI